MKTLRNLLQQARHQMWEEGIAALGGAPTNRVGDGSKVGLPPAIEPPGIPASKKKKSEYDGRTKAGRKFVNKVLLGRQKRESKQMSKVNEQLMIEEPQKKGGAPSETERAQQQIAQQKKLNRQKELAQKSQEAKAKMMAKTKEMDTLMKARLSDFRKKAAQQTTKLQKQVQGFEPSGDNLQETIGTIQHGQEVLSTLMRLAGDSTFEPKEGYLQWQDGRSLKVNSDLAKRMVSTFESLDNARQQVYRELMNRDVESFLKIMQFSSTQM